MNRKPNNFPSKLSNKQKHTLDYWRVATREIENTCLSVLHLFYRNDDYVNYLKYQQHFRNFKDFRSVLSDVVLKTVETNNFFLMESVVIDSVKHLQNIITMNSSMHRNRRETEFGRHYNEIALIIIKCLLILKNKLRDLGSFNLKSFRTYVINASNFQKKKSHHRPF